MKKLAYFLILLVGFNTYADQVGTGMGATVRSGDDGSCANAQAEGYVQMLHWRTFVVFYMARCSRSDSAEVGHYVTNIGGYLQRPSPEAQVAERYLNQRGIVDRHVSSGKGDGPAYAAASGDKCNTELANRYEQLYQSQGESAFCGSNKAKYEDLLNDKNVESVKSKARSAACSAGSALFSAGICSPQPHTANTGGGTRQKTTPGLYVQSTTGTPTINTIATTDITTGASAPPPRPATAAPTTPVAAAPAAPAAGGSGNDGEAPPAQIQMAMADGPKARAGQGRSVRRKKPRAATQSAEGASASGTTDTATGDTPEDKDGNQDSTVGTAARTTSTRVAQAGGAAPQSAAPSSSITLNNKGYEKLFSDSAACAEKSPEQALRKKLSHFDASIEVYNQLCQAGAKDKSAASLALSKYRQHIIDGIENTYKIKAVQQPYLDLERSRAGGPQSDYCRQRATFFKDVTTTPSTPQIVNFANSKMCN